MRNPNDETERFKRLRDRQITSRDPKVKDKQFLQNYSKRETKRKKTSLVEVMKVLHKKWWGFLIGFFVGLAIWISMAFLMIDSGIAVHVIGIAILLILVIIGVIIGSVFDWKDEVTDI